jgi:hypothetical protein
MKEQQETTITNTAATALASAAAATVAIQAMLQLYKDWRVNVKQ